MFGLGSQELVVILIIVVILFGAKRLPELARSLGSGIKEFKAGINESKADTGASTSKANASAEKASLSCAYCRSPLEAEWSHCPRCGKTVVAGSTLPPQ